MEIKSGAENAYLEIPERPSYQVLRGFSAFSYENAEKYGEQDKGMLLTSFARHSRGIFAVRFAPGSPTPRYRAPGPLLRISTPFRFLPAPHSVLRGPVFLCRRCFPAGAGAWHSVRYADNCGNRREFRPVSPFFSETFFIKKIFPLIFFSFCILSQAVCTCLLYMFFQLYI